MATTVHRADCGSGGTAPGDPLPATGGRGRAVLAWLLLVPVGHLLAVAHEWIYFPSSMVDELLARGPLRGVYRTAIVRGGLGFLVELALVAGVIALLRRRPGAGWARALGDGALHLLPLGLAPLLLFVDQVQTRLLLFATLVAGTAAVAVFRCLPDAPAREAPGAARSAWPRRLAATFAALAACYYAVLAVLQHESYWSSVYDLGLFAGSLRSTLHGDGFLFSPQFGCTFMAEHFAPVLALLAPVYALYQDPLTLQVVGSLAMAGAGWLVFLIADETLEDGWLALAFCASWLLLPDTFQAQWHGFKMDLLEPAMILGAVLALVRGSGRWFLLCVALLWATKEDAFIATTALGLYAWIAHGRRRLGPAVVVASIALGVVLVTWVMPAYSLFQEPGTYFRRFSGEGYKFADRYSHLGSTLPAVVANALANPAYVAGWLAGEARLAGILALLAPLGFLAALGGFRTLLLLVPALEMLLASFDYMYSLDYYYSAVPLAFAYAAAVAGLAFGLRRLERVRGAGGESVSEPVRRLLRRLDPPKIRTGAAAYLVVAVLVLAWYDTDSPLSPANGRPAYLTTPRTALLDEIVASIPPDAAISATGYAGIHLMDRPGPGHVPFGIDGSDWVLVDLYRPPFPMTEAAIVSLARSLLGKPEWGVVRSERGIVLLRRGAPRLQNDAALAMLDQPVIEPEEWEMSQYANLAVRSKGASNGAALMVTPADRRGPGLLFWGPDWPLRPGEYEVSWRLAAERQDHEHPNRTVATIGVFSAGRQLVGRTLRFSDFDWPDAWQDFSLRLRIDEETQTGFRVFYHDVGSLALDAVWVARLGP